MKAVTTLTAAEKRTATRLRNKQKQAAAFQHRFDLFESMTAEESEDLIGRLADIKDDYERRMEEAEQEILEDLQQDFEGILKDYSYDMAKSWLEEFANGKMGHPFVFDMNQWADEHKDETSFEWNPKPISPEVVAEIEAAMKRNAEARKESVRPLTDLYDTATKAAPQSTAPARKCGVCGRPWIDGACSGGFVNHTES